MRRKIIFTLSGMMMLVLLMGCKDFKFYSENDYFIYVSYRNHVVIRELTESGRNLKELYVPPFLNDLPVINIGDDRLSQVDTLKSDQLETLNIPYTTTSFFKLSGLTNLKVLIITNTTPFSFEGTFQSPMFYKDNLPAIYVPIGYSSIFEEQNKNYLFQEANISLLFNYENSPNDGFYFIDYKEPGQRIFQPMEPKRPGYSFGGWYEEKECINKWDFDKPIEDSKELFAYWIKN